MCICCLARCERDYCNDQEVRAVADAMATNGMKELGYEYINLDGESMNVLAVVQKQKISFMHWK